VKVFRKKAFPLHPDLHQSLHANMSFGVCIYACREAREVTLRFLARGWSEAWRSKDKSLHPYCAVHKWVAPCGWRGEGKKRKPPDARARTRTGCTRAGSSKRKWEDLYLSVDSTGAPAWKLHP